MSRSHVTRFLLGLLVTLGLTEGAARLVAARVPYDPGWNNDAVGQRFQALADLPEPPDVLFVGSSVVTAAVDPPTVLDAFAPGAGLSGFNAGLGAGTMRTLEPWMTDVVLPEQCTRAVVMGITVRDWNGGSESAATNQRDFDDSIAYRRRLGDELGFFDGIEASLGEHSALVATRSLLRTPHDLLNGLRWGGVRPITAEGRDTAFPGRIGTTPPDGDPALRELFADFSPGGPEADALIELIRRVERAGALPVLVDMPVLREDLARSLPGGDADWERYQAAVRDVVASTGVTYLDLTDETGDRRGWQNEYHTNADGWEPVSRSIGEALRASGVELPTWDEVSCSSFERRPSATVVTGPEG